jgi:hypothetical protein
MWNKNKIINKLLYLSLSFNKTLLQSYIKKKKIPPETPLFTLTHAVSKLLKELQFELFP